MLSQDFISDHPPEISGLILSYLSIDDLRNCARVCRTWRSYALQDMLYLPYVLERYNRLSHERSSTQNELGKHHIAKELLERFPRLSATTYFENSASLRDLAIRNLQLEKSWKSGKPSNITTVKLLNQPGRLTCATIDSISKAIIVGTTSEYVLVIGSECGNILQTFRLPSQWSSVLTVGKDSLVIGSHSRDMYIARRIKDVQVSQIFDTQLLHFQIPGLPASILIEDSVCIIGCFGGPIAFFDIGCRGGTADVCPSTEIPFSTNTHHDLAIEKEQVGNLCCRCRPEHLLNIFPKDGEAFHSKSDTISSMHYRKPFLFVASFCVEQISPLPRQMDKDNRRHLWEYPSEALAIKQCQMPILPEDEEPPPANRCSIHPFGGDGDLLVAWPDTSIYRLGNFSPKLIWEPSSEMLVERVDIDMMQITGLNVVGNCFLVNFSDGSVDLFDENGDFLQSWDDANKLYAPNINFTDPCFILTLSDHQEITIRSFVPKERAFSVNAPSSDPRSPSTSIGEGSEGSPASVGLLTPITSTSSSTPVSNIDRDLDSPGCMA